MQQKEDSFVFYLSFFESISDLKDKKRLKIYDAICNFALFGIEPELDGIEKTLWKLIIPQLSANRKKRSDGRLGGRERRKKTTTGSENETTTGSEKKEPNVNVNVNGNVNGNEKENGEEIPQKIADLLKPLNKISPSPLEIKNLSLAAKAGCTQDTVKNLLRRKPTIAGFTHSWQIDELMAQLRIDKGDSDGIDAELERRYGKRSN